MKSNRQKRKSEVEKEIEKLDQFIKILDQELKKEKEKNSG